MYCDYYGLKISPFNVTSDPEFFFESVSHKEALACLLYGVEDKKGIILITGEVGTGKTTLCKAFLNRLNPQAKVSIIFNPYFDEVQLLQAIVEDFGLRLEKKSRLDIAKKLDSFLIDISLKGGNAVLIIDEAQNLTGHQLEQIRLLSNLETSQEKLLQIVLVGQPELSDKLEQFHLRQIRQRIFVKYNISPLKEEEVKNYVEFRLKKSGKNKIKILPGCYKVIYDFSGGIPRLVNMLCDRALLLGFVREKMILDQEMFESCVKEIR
ncbi:MAG: AAA family ATPase [Candidatus Omnitrophota bacterium]